MFTFILHVSGEVMGIRNLYCMPFCSARSGLCARPRDFQNRLLNVVLVNFGRPLLPLIMEQTPTAFLVDGQRGSFETAPNRSLNSPRAFFETFIWVACTLDCRCFVRHHFSQPYLSVGIIVAFTTFDFVLLLRSYLFSTVSFMPSTTCVALPILASTSSPSFHHY